MSQNLFDNEKFFNQYMDLRMNKKNYNDLMEQPEMKRLLPDVQGLNVLDIGCGYGENCLNFAMSGAEHVVGIDISSRMLEVARINSSHPVIEYIHMDMAELNTLKGMFDLAYSSLAFHYEKDFHTLINTIYEYLNPGGILLFSQEHPIVTATKNGEGHYNRDENGNCISYTFADYGYEGKRSSFWYIDNVENYHRRMGTIVSTLAHIGFIIEELVETLPDRNALQQRPDMIKEYMKPSFLIIRARKQV